MERNTVADSGHALPQTPITVKMLVHVSPPDPIPPAGSATGTIRSASDHL